MAILSSGEGGWSDTLSFFPWGRELERLGNCNYVTIGEGNCFLKRASNRKKGKLQNLILF